MAGLTSDKARARALPREGYAGTVSARVSNAIFNGLEGEHDIAQTEVGVGRGRRDGGWEETQYAQAVLHEHGHDARLGCQRAAVEPCVGDRALDVRAAVDPACQ